MTKQPKQPAAIDGLNTRQAAFVKAMINNGQDAVVAARIAGYQAPHQQAQLLKKNPRIKAAIDERLEVVVGTQLKPLAIGTLRKLMLRGSTDDVKLRAAKTVLEMTGDLRKVPDQRTSGLEDMDRAALQQMLREHQAKQVEGQVIPNQPVYDVEPDESDGTSSTYGTGQAARSTGDEFNAADQGDDDE